MMDGKISMKEALKRIAWSKGMAHTYYNLPIGLIGADHDKESIIEDMKNAHTIVETGPESKKIGHGVAVVPSMPCKQSDILFIETKDKYNQRVDVNGK